MKKLKFTLKTESMKNSRSQNNKQSKQMTGHKPKPDVRDDLDSRKEKEPTKVQTSREKGSKFRKS
jgi:hypothetical protein